MLHDSPGNIVVTVGNKAHLGRYCDRHSNGGFGTDCIVQVLAVQRILL